jgi:hypothetical protein
MIIALLANFQGSNRITGRGSEYNAKTACGTHPATCSVGKTDDRLPYIVEMNSA